MTAHSQEYLSLRLSENEALVLFEFVSRFSEQRKLTIEDQAEERMLWDICSSLEKELTAPLNPDYAELLAKAREIVRDKK